MAIEINVYSFSDIQNNSYLKKNYFGYQNTRKYFRYPKQLFWISTITISDIKNKHLFRISKIVILDIRNSYFCYLEFFFRYLKLMCQSRLKVKFGIGYCSMYI